MMNELEKLREENGQLKVRVKELEALVPQQAQTAGSNPAGSSVQLPAGSTANVNATGQQSPTLAATGAQ